MAKGKGEEKDDVEVEEGKKSGKKSPVLMIVLISVTAIAVLAGTVFGTLYFVGGKSAKKGKAPTEQSADAEADAAAEEDGGDGEGAGEGEDGAKHPANYISLDPPFVVNFEGTGPARFLQITVEVMSRKPEAAEQIKKHMPVIRNNLVLLFSSQTYDKVNTLKGKEELRQAALVEVQKIIEEETGSADVEALYFTSFVMQ